MLGALILAMPFWIVAVVLLIEAGESQGRR